MSSAFVILGMALKQGRMEKALSGMDAPRVSRPREASKGQGLRRVVGCDRVRPRYAPEDQGTCVVSDVLELEAAADFVRSVKDRADYWVNDAPLFFGWALREAFWAGVRFGKGKRRL